MRKDVMERSDWMLPAALGAGVDGDAAGEEFGEQLGNCWGSFAIAGYDYSPLQIFSKFFGANLPLAEGRRCLLTDLDDGPMACQGDGGFFIGQRPAEDEVVVAMDQDANHL
jgi:hypothetical protein